MPSRSWLDLAGQQVGMIRKTSPIELWGGVECTVNRVGDSYIDQLDRTGHTQRLSDFDLFKNLGIKALRQPVLWERAAQLGDAAWDWPDAAMGRLRANDIRADRRTGASRQRSARDQFVGP